MKLKTLKDMKMNMQGQVYAKDLRALAIKWVKFYNQKQNEFMKDKVLFHYYAGKMSATIEQNNITEDDLK